MPVTGDCSSRSTLLTTSVSWAIKNCGFLLFSSIIDSLLKTTANKSDTDKGWNGNGVRIDYAKYPALVDILVKLLQSGDPAHNTVMPAMDIIRRAGPPNIPDSPNTRSVEIENLVFQHLSDSNWHDREAAAEAYCSITMSDRLELVVLGTLAQGAAGPNHRHGLLKAVLAILSRRLTLEGPILEGNTHC